MSKTVLMKLLIGGGITTALATGGYYLANGLGGRNKSRAKRELTGKGRNNAGDNSNLGMDEDDTKWELIFKSSGGNVVCQRRGLREDLPGDPFSQQCDSSWMNQWEEKVKGEGELRLRVKKDFFKGNEESLKRNVKGELEEKLDNLGFRSKSEITTRTCELEDKENDNNNYYVFICK